MAWDPLNRKAIEGLRTELQLTKNEYTGFIQKTTNTVEDLERMIQRERGSSQTYETLVRQFYKIGDSYMSDLWVRRSIDLIAQNIAGLGFSIYDKSGENVVEAGPVVDLFDYINDEDSRSDFIYEIVRSLIRYGKSFVWLNGLGKLPQSLEVLQANRMKAVSQNGTLQSWDYSASSSNKVTIRHFTPEEILFIRYKHPEDQWDGLSPVSAAIKEILLNFYSYTFNIKNMESGAMGAGVWIDPAGNPLTQAQKDEAQRAMDQTFNKGVDNAGKTLVLKRRLEWVRTSETNRDLDFSNLLDKMRDGILAALGVPKVLFASSEATFTNLNEAKKIFWSQTALPICHLLEDTFNSNFFLKKSIPNSLYFDIEDIPELQDDRNTLIASFKILIDAKVPPAIAAEVVGLEFPEGGWEGWDQAPSPALSPFQQQPNEEPNAAEIVAQTIKQMRIEEEKNIVDDAFLLDLEYKKTLNTVLQSEKEIFADVDHFFKDRYQDIERFITNYPIKEVKTVVDPNWIEDFKKWLGQKDWGLSFVGALKDNIAKTFTKGKRRTYWGVGAQFNQGSERALGFVTTRGLKLQGAPKVVQDSIITMLGSKAYTVDEMAAEIANKWKEATLARAKLISITESTAAYNGGRVEGMKELHIKKKEWVHSHDVKVRDSHLIDEIVDVDKPFTLRDGVKVMYPGDGPPEDSCNCRCICVSVLN